MTLWRQYEASAVEHSAESRTSPLKLVRTTSAGRHWCDSS